LKEEIKRINQLVADGKLTPDDAADLIDAFYNSEHEEGTYSEAKQTVPPKADGSPGDQKEYSSESKPRDPFRAIIDTVERLGKEVTENVDWKNVTDSARTNAKKGLDALKSGLEEVNKGKFNMSWLFSTTTREIRLPLTLKEGQLLKIENGSGHVTVTPDTAESYVIAHVKVRGANQEDAKAKADLYTLVVENSDHAVEIKQPHETGLDVDLEIFVAATPGIEVKSEAGHVTIKDTKNSCRITSTDGRIDLSGLDGLRCRPIREMCILLIRSRTTSSLRTKRATFRSIK
jgi:polyhydroxyalkanoate synthesis regulator phasin